MATKREATASDYEAFKEACLRVDRQAAQCVLDQTNLSANFEECEIGFELLCDVIEYMNDHEFNQSDISFLVWMCHTLDMNVISFRSGKNNRAQYLFPSACAHGSLEIVQWVVDTFGLTATDARSNNHAAVSSLRYNRTRPEVAKWVITKFGLTSADVRQGLYKSRGCYGDSEDYLRKFAEKSL